MRERRKRTAAGALCLASALIAGCGMGGNETAAAKLDALLTARVAGGEPGIAVLAAKDGRPVAVRCRGVGDLGTLRPLDERTDFRLASVSKQFTALAVMLLVHDGRLRYEDRLTDLLPGFPAYGREITLRSLLDHTSGLPDYEDLMPAPPPAGWPASPAPSEPNQITDAEVLGLLERAGSGLFRPGTRWRYSNSGYVVLGEIVARASGRSFPEFLRERIFSPAGMTGAVAFVRGVDEVPNRAFGHTRVDGRWTETDQSPTSATLGDGGIYSSLLDLLAWDRALRTHALLGEREMAPAWTPVRVPSDSPVGPDGSPAEYGFGWFLDAWQGRRRTWHYGETVGFRTAIQRFVDDGLTVVVLANRADVDAAALALEIARLYL